MEKALARYIRRPPLENSGRWRQRPGIDGIQHINNEKIYFDRISNGITTLTYGQDLKSLKMRKSSWEGSAGARLLLKITYTLQLK